MRKLEAIEGDVRKLPLEQVPELQDWLAEYIEDLVELKPNSTRAFEFAFTDSRDIKGESGDCNLFPRIRRDLFQAAWCADFAGDHGKDRTRIEAASSFLYHGIKCALPSDTVFLQSAHATSPRHRNRTEEPRGLAWCRLAYYLCGLGPLAVGLGEHATSGASWLNCRQLKRHGNCPRQFNRCLV